MMRSSLILGEGYVGQHLKTHLQSQSIEVVGTHRNCPVEFELSRPETWENLPIADVTYWLFAADNPEQVELFLQSRLKHLGRIVLLGTTSHFVEQEVVYENTLSASSQRSACEVKLIQAGATIVRSSGIIGAKRSPFDWVRRGRIHEFNKTVNLIDVEDLVQFLRAAEAERFVGREYIAHGFTEVWRNIVSEMEDFALPQSPSQIVTGKTIDNTFSKQQLGVKLKVSNIQEFKRIHGSQPIAPRD